MKIVFLHMTMGLESRGSEVSTDLLATELAKKHEVLVIGSGPISKRTYTTKRVYPLSSAPSPAPVGLIGKIRSHLYLDDASLKVKQFTIESLPLIREFHPDMIIATNGLPQLYVLRGEVSKAKIVVFGRAGMGYHDRDSLRTGPDLFIALSEQAANWAKGLGGHKTRVVYIPNPIRVTKAQKIDLKLKNPVVMCVGALSKYKNVDKVIEAVRLTNASLLLIGDGEEREGVQQSLSTLPNEFRWIRHVDPSELPSYYGSADVFCFVPDEQEAFGRVYLEAMVAGLPIVASYDHIRRAIVGQQGIFVNPRDVSDIAMGINTAIQLNKLNYSDELKEYELKTVAAQIEKEFHDLIK